MIEIKIKSKPLWKNYNRCHIGISLHNPNLDGDRLRAIVNWINAQHFEECFIDLSDTLHRHNFSLRYSMREEDALKMAIDEGNKWLDKNGPILDSLRMKQRFFRWSHWLRFPDVAAGLHAFHCACAADKDFHAALVRDVTLLGARSGRKADDAYITAGTNYLLEELAVLSFYFRDYPCAKIYPGREQNSFRMVREGRVPHVPPGLQNVFYTQLWLHNDQETAAPDRAAA